jgi:UDP-glucose 4-epimerase
MATTVMVTGGAGYVGSHTVAALRAAGYPVVVVDNLATGHRAAVGPVPLTVADLHDVDHIRAVIRRHGVGAVVHFAASSVVPESIRDPAFYYHNNIGGTAALLRAMVAEGASTMVFSSTAGVYGESPVQPIPEEVPAAPSHPYGATKRAIEELLTWAYAAYGLRSVALRYFNAAGADPARDLGEDHRPETHLIPRVLRAAWAGQAIPVYGTDYPTPDGTAIRDYVHVLDLAEAHVLALQWLTDHPGAHVFNVGSGRGQSVLAVIEAARRVTDRPIPLAPAPPRPGDPPALVAETGRIEAAMGWKPTRSDLDTIIESAWSWIVRHPSGYADAD